MNVLLRILLQHALLNPPLPLRVLILLAAIFAYGASGFLYFELPGNPDLNWGDALWYTIVTMATVGYGDLFPKTFGGRFFVGVPLMVLGIGLLAYALSVLAMALISARNKELQGMSQYRLHDHLVLFNDCGSDKILRILAEFEHDSAARRFQDIVLVDEHLAELPPELHTRGIRFVRGNPTRDATLDRAAIDNASHALILSRPGDASAADSLNLAIALAIEARNPRVNTVVECADPAASELLRKAGCDKIVCLSRFEASFLAQELLNPGLQEVIDELASSVSGQQLYYIPLQLQAARPFGELARTARERGHLAIGFRHGEGNTLNPAETSLLQPGDQLITVGATRIETIG